MTEQLIDKIFQERYQIQTLLGRQTGRRTFLAKDLQTQSQVVVSCYYSIPTLPGMT